MNVCTRAARGLAARRASRASGFGLTDAVRLGFRAGFVAVLLLAFGWAVSDLRQVPPDSRAVVQRFGQIERVQEAGLVLAWPNPIEQVTLVPAYDRQVALKIEVPANTGPILGNRFPGAPARRRGDAAPAEGCLERPVFPHRRRQRGAVRCHPVLPRHRSRRLCAVARTCRSGLAAPVPRQRGNDRIPVTISTIFSSPGRRMPSIRPVRTSPAGARRCAGRW